jgi:glyoxylase-like metal-dependent hydrolase (beta-lactamase superfamily II)
VSASSYRRGLEDLGDGLYAWMQPDGGWGWSNAGFIRDGEDSMLVDTLFDETLTAAMLDSIRDATGIAAGQIATLVNTHANGDHTHGNALVANAEVIASDAAAREMSELTAAAMAELKRGGSAGRLGDAGDYFAEIFAPFDFARARGRPPTRTFDRRLDIRVGRKAVELHRLGPAHTAGDTLVWLPAERAVFTGDILFVDSTPVMWSGPVENWLAACDWILAAGARRIVPGHGPITDARGVRRLQEYLRYVQTEARSRFDAGMNAEEAARDIALGEYRHWLDPERIAVNVDTLYREFSGDRAPPDMIGLFGRMARLRRELRK